MAPILSMQFRKAAITSNLCTAIVTPGPPQNITLQIAISRPCGR
jgi:hypothetical protein